ncbi:MAG: TonB-dependent receptor [Bacteroidales bacterium]|nr:TonB-dependent receptor [Bacteroidales bacterium]
MYNRLILLLLIMVHSLVARAETIKVRVLDEDGFAVDGASVYLQGEGISRAGVSDDKGNVVFNDVRKGQSLSVIVTHISFKTNVKTLTVDGDKTLRIPMKGSSRQLRDVVVTAKEEGITSTSTITKEAMNHLQPSSFTDIMSLLPGGTVSTPNLTEVNSPKLREAGGMSGEEYATSALGTSFLIDGAPISTDANMQYLPGAGSGDAASYSRTSVNRGVDMRTISTDEIEKVEIVRGIPSVEYGDLTSGLVKIERTSKATPWKARFKTDGYGKLFYFGKGMAWDNEKHVLNFGVDYLDAKADPRNNLENYKRITATARLNSKWDIADRMLLKWSLNADYTGSLDNEKEDHDLNYLSEDKYISEYHKAALSNTLNLSSRDTASFFRSAELMSNASYSYDYLLRQQFVQLDRDRAMPSDAGVGAHDGEYLPYQYVARYVVNGMPLNVFVKAKASFGGKAKSLSHRLTVGAEWKMDKNYGMQDYDMTRPMFVGTITRPRDYGEIPAMHQMSVYAQEKLSLVFAKNTVNVEAGVRANSLVSLGSAYSMDGKVYVDPRMNVQWKFPKIEFGESQRLVFFVSGGIGQHTKMPTIMQLYPDKFYNDIAQLNYFHLNKDYRRLNIMTYIVDRTNYEIKPARNLKWELRFGFDWSGNNFSVTYFQENMDDGFRSSTMCMPFAYTQYDASGVDASALIAPPALESLPSSDQKRLDTYSTYANGSRIDKKGIEFQLQTIRFKPIRTRFTVNGAYFRTVYVNSQPMFETVSNVVGDVTIMDKYVGLYDWNAGYEKEVLNGNIIADTYIQKLGLTVSLTAEFEFFSSNRRMWQDGVPVQYMDENGVMHEYTEADKTDTYLQYLVKTYNVKNFEKRTVPIAMYVNFKASKTITRYMTLSFFIDKIFDWLPDYEVESLTIRRSSKPYFGMEMNFKL